MFCAKFMCKKSRNCAKNLCLIVRFKLESKFLKFYLCFSSFYAFFPPCVKSRYSFLKATVSHMVFKMTLTYNLILWLTQAKHSEKIKQNILFHFSIYLPAASDLLVCLNREILIKHYDKFSAKGLRSVAEDWCRLLIRATNIPIDVDVVVVVRFVPLVIDHNLGYKS